MSDRRFIEVDFPVKEVSKESEKEKNIRHGHISTLHIWWARRPLASSRATNYAALIPAPENEEKRKKTLKFIAELSKWENSLNKEIIEKARKDILEYFRKIRDDPNQQRPRVLDPFAGGGAIPLEALRLGCETYASDYNPVAVLILKATLEYPQKYGRKNGGKSKNGVTLDKFGIKANGKSEDNEYDLVADVEKWGKWVLEEARKELERFYPKDPDGSVPVGYIWARTIKCQSLKCGVEIPLMRQFWLAKKKNKKVFLFPYIWNGRIEFAIIDASDMSGFKFPVEEIKERLRKFLGMDEREWQEYEGEVRSKYPYYYEHYLKDGINFDPSNGTISRAKVTCPVCGYTHSDDWLRQYFREGKAGERMVAVVLTKPGERGKQYRIASDSDIKAFEEAKKYLEEKIPKLRKEWGIEPVPNEPLPPKGTLGFRVQNYGMTKWGDLFNDRQKLVLITFAEKIREAYSKMLEIKYDSDYARAIATYLGLILSSTSNYSSNVMRWVNSWEVVAATFSRQALPMVWDYPELNIVTADQGWPAVLALIREVLNRLSSNVFEFSAKVIQSSATNLPFSDNYFDAVFTDPPYYDNVPYSDLSDFFYVWLKRSIGQLHPELFTTPLTPKTKELVADPVRRGNSEEAKRYFESGMMQAFREIHRILKPNGIVVIVYAHKTTEGWESMINALLDSGLVPTASWPIHTELKKRLRAKESAALASSIYIVARKIKKQGIGWFEEVQEELEEYLTKKLDQLWEEGISGADFFIAAIGSAIEVFGKYEKVMDYDGNEVRADRLLEFVRDFVAKYTLRNILHEEISAEISPLTKFYLLWRWAYGEAKVHFDDARKLATSVGVELEEHWNRGFIKKEGEFIRVLGPQDRKPGEITSYELIDVLHKALLYWERGMKGNMLRLLAETGWGTREIFYKVAQAISSSLPNESKEKKLIDGFLAGKDSIIQAIQSGEYRSMPVEVVEEKKPRRKRKKKSKITLDVFGVKPKEE